MRRWAIWSLVVFLGAACWAAESQQSEVAARLAPIRHKLNSPDKKTREEACDAYLKAGDEGRTLLRDSLLSLRNLKIATCRGFSIPEATEKKLLITQQKLEEARKEALRVIFDRKIYPDADHGRVGQPVVDEAVKKVKDIVDRYGQPLFGWSLRFGHLPGSRAEALALVWSPGSPVKRFAKAAAAYEHLLEIDGRLTLLDAKDVELKPPLDKLLGSKIDPELVKGLGQLAGFLDHAERCLRYNALIRTTASAGERRVVDLTNEYRIQLGIPPMAINELLVQAARKHSQEMQHLGYFAHDSPVAENKSPGQRCQNEGYRYCRGENIASGGGADMCFNMWYNSSGHHRNMINPTTTEIGVGQGGSFTEDFGADPALDLDKPPQSWKPDAPKADKK